MPSDYDEYNLKTATPSEKALVITDKQDMGLKLDGLKAAALAPSYAYEFQEKGGING